MRAQTNSRIFEVVSEQGVETRRTARDVAENDVQILRFLGKKATVEEVSSAVDTGEKHGA
jgi:hypothetical protein